VRGGALACTLCRKSACQTLVCAAEALSSFNVWMISSSSSSSSSQRKCLLLCRLMFCYPTKPLQYYSALEGAQRQQLRQPPPQQLHRRSMCTLAMHSVQLLVCNTAASLSKNWQMALLKVYQH
jgi:hypothetical protein